MALSKRDVALAAAVALLALLGLLPTFRLVAYAFCFGILATLAGVLLLIFTTSRGSAWEEEHHRTARPKGLKFLDKSQWPKELEARDKQLTYKPAPLYPESFLISAALDEILDLILRDFIKSWYSKISANPRFTNEIDRIIRAALLEIRDRLLSADLVEVAVERFVPVITNHFRDFYDAERAVRGKHLNRNVTESEELDLAIAGKYKNGKLHEAASLAYSDTRFVQQQYLRKMAKKILPQTVPGEVLASRAVDVIIEELVACAVLFPVMSMLSDPDTWNQIMENYGRSVLQDRSTVRKLRKALDEHASPAPKAKPALPFPRLSPNDNERRFEKFIRAARKVNNLSDGRRFRSEVSSQLMKDSTKEGVDAVYLRRLEIGKKILDQRVEQLASGSWNGHSGGNKVIASRLSTELVPDTKVVDARLEEILRDSSALSYFMEYMDRQRVMPLVQFWLVVDGFRNPLEEDPEEDGEVPASLPPWSSADRADLAQISEAYLSRPELDIPEHTKKAVRDFLKAGKGATQQQYYAARGAILQAQTNSAEKMKEKYLKGFKKSDLFYKWQTSQEASKRMSASSVLNPFDAPNRPEVGRAASAQVLSKSQPSRQSARPHLPMKAALHRATQSSLDIPSIRQKQMADLTSSTHSLDETPESPLFGDDDAEVDGMADSVHSLDGDHHDGPSQPDDQVVEAIEAELNNIMKQKTDLTVEDLQRSGGLFGTGDSPSNSLLFGHDSVLVSPRGSMDTTRKSIDSGRGNSGRPESERPNLASLGLVNTSSRIGVFTDDDLFGDEQKFASDEHESSSDPDKDDEDAIHEAAPGDLGLAEAISALTVDIDRLIAQSAVVDSLLRKAELTNNAAELRILRKSKASLSREVRRKELQRQQYVLQESDNSLYGRATIRIKSFMVGKESDGKEYALYVVELQRAGGQHMPAASWVVTRRYSEFWDLHQKLREKYRGVRHLDFPRRRVVMKLQNEFLNKRRAGLERYMRELLRMPEVCRDRDLRAFLSQSAIAPNANTDAGKLGNKGDMMTRFLNGVSDGVEDILGNIPALDQLSSAGQNLLNAAQAQLPAAPTTSMHHGLGSEDATAQAEAERELRAFEAQQLDTDGDAEAAEPFVKPIADLFLEIFSLNRGSSASWLRGRAVVVVLHQLLGGTIERKVRDSVKNLTSEDAVLGYIGKLKEGLWPGGVKKEGGVPRGVKEREKTRREAGVMLAMLVPDLVGGVVGRVNAERASRRVFAGLNNGRLNMHLAFTLLDEVIDVLFGEKAGKRV